MYDTWKSLKRIVVVVVVVVVVGVTGFLPPQGFWPGAKT